MSYPKLCDLIYQEHHFNKFLRNGIIVDSGVLLEFFKLRYKRNNDLTLTSMEKLLLERLERFLSIGYKYITPHLLSELSNLINTKIHSAGSYGFSECVELIKTEFEQEDYSEIPIKKEQVLGLKEVNKFGVADAGIILISRNSKRMNLKVCF